MKTGLDHLPGGKRRELEHVQTVLMSELREWAEGNGAEMERF